MQPGDDGSDLAALCQLEECVRGVEDAGLQEQHEGHPLVVRVVCLLLVLHVRGQTRVGEVLTLHSWFICKISVVILCTTLFVLNLFLVNSWKFNCIDVG